ncbi:MAG TPA: MFS transporter, partial [Dermatophilaceae bacterium]
AGAREGPPEMTDVDLTAAKDLAAKDLAGTRAMLAVAGLFAVNGLLIGGFGATLPAMRERLGVGAGGLAVLLVSLSTAAVISMQIGGRLADSRGARNVALPACALLIAGIVSLAFAPNLPLACAAVVVTGLGNGAMDVSMNALGVRVEQARVKPVMSRLHACFSIGTLAGAAAVVLIAWLVVGGAGVVTPSLATLGAVSLVALVAISRGAPSTPPVTAVIRPAGGPRLPAGTLLLGAMAFSFGLAEGTAMDWSSVHVTDVAGVKPSTGALGLVAVSAFMVLIRLLGDRAVAAFGRAAVVRFGGLVAASGYLVAILGQPLPVLLAGWAMVGLGVGMIAPQVYAAAGHSGGGRMLAVVVTFGYGAFLIGPAVMGALIGLVGIRGAMALPLALSVVLVALSTVLSRLDAAGGGPAPAERPGPR